MESVYNMVVNGVYFACFVVYNIILKDAGVVYT